MYPEWAEQSQKYKAARQGAKEQRKTFPFIDRSLPFLELTENNILKIAREHNKGPLPFIFLYQGFYETTLRTLKKISFRKRSNNATCAAYCAMNTKEFEAINLRQARSNWRTIPRNLNHRLPNRPLRVIDLCCGTGQSTEVLAYYCAPGSEILGLEFNPDFVALARARGYVDEHGRPCRVHFHVQSVLETFRDSHGRRIAGTNIDLVNCCGAIGCHFDPASTEKIAAEACRVLKPGGFATIDSGKQGTTRAQLERIFKAEGFKPVHAAKSCVVDRYTQVCFIKS